MRIIAFVLGGIAAVLALGTLLDTELSATDRTMTVMPVLAMLAVAAAVLSLRLRAADPADDEREASAELER
jgi:hypothetical protein